ncbi:B12-binding domain-containing radical SAM protein [Spirochaeta africana]|uniref:B12-binding domain-containing radical SAM protein n=1 Tax=Spirochaeta africana TaxID=46355 RepID=UPI00145C8CB4|nr:B12-binding domain-containing radical SAM protein [Spirochaeta africana]
MKIPVCAGIPAAGNTTDPEILLVSVNAGFIHASLGLRSLLANLGEFESRAGILEGTRRLGVPALAAAVAELSPLIVGVSVSIWNHGESRELLSLLRSALPEVWLVVGGPEAGYLPADHGLFLHADVLIRGEGELAFARLCGELLGSAAGVVRRSGNAGLREISGHIPDLSGVQLPYARLHDSDLRHRLIYVETSRGCPFGCEFCLSSVQGRVRCFPLEPVLEEIRQLYARGGRWFKMIDRSFNIDIPRARRTLEFFLALFRSGRNPDAYVQFEVVPDRLPYELRDLISQFPPGTLRLEVGIQTFNNEVAARINRRQNQRKTLDNLAFLAHASPAVIHADLIIGLPGEDLASFAAGFDRLWQLRPGEIQLGVLKALPGTSLHRHDHAWGMVWNSEPPYEILQTGAIDRAVMDELKILAKYWELVVNRGRFPDLVERLLPLESDHSAFARFRTLSRALYAHFGRTWGIDAAELGEVAYNCLDASVYPGRT